MIRIYVKEPPLWSRIFGIMPKYFSLIKADHMGDYVEIKDEVTKITLSKELKRDTKAVSWRKVLKESKGYCPIHLGGYSISGGHYELSFIKDGEWKIEAETNTLETLLTLEKIMRTPEEIVTIK